MNVRTIESAKRLPWLLASLLVLIMAGVSGPALADAEHEYDEAVKYMNNGYAEMGKVFNALADDEDKKAYKRFNKALDDFSKADVHLAKAALPESDQPAIKAMKKGLDALRSCVKALEKNDVDSAQQDYDTAQNYFAQASVLLD